ncbi:MAG: DNA polymerase I [Armatimonadetes bacterium]|nr:DNA polymerase I [Armatimonadota bacterium]
MPRTRRRVVVVDGNSLLYRAFFAMPGFSTLDNQPTNAVYGFTMMLLKLVQDESPDVLLVAFDAPAKTFRHEAFDQYKAHRKPTPDDLRSQAPLAREMVDAFNAPILEVPGFEADDLVGTVARTAEAEGYDVLIVTGDLDTLQLVDDHVSVLTTVKGVSETVTYDSKAVCERYGLRPDQLVDFKALKGDASDNIPGVPGIGDKSATKLIQEYGSLDNVLAHIDEIADSRARNALKAAPEMAEQSRHLARIVTDVPLDLDLEACGYRGPDFDSLRDLFKRLEFKSLLRRLPDDSLTDSQQSLFSPAERPTQYVDVRDPRALGDLLDRIREAGALVLRINTSSAHPVSAEPLGAGISVEGSGSYYVEFGSSGLSLDDLRPVLESTKIRTLAHNLKHEIQLLAAAGIELAGPRDDVMLSAYLLNAGRGSHSLADVALDYLGVELPARDPRTGRIPAPGGEWMTAQWFSAQADVIRRSAPLLTEKLDREGLASLYAEIEMPLVPILADMELSGVVVDQAWLGALSRKLEHGINRLEVEIHRLAGMEFNIGSSKQLQEVLYDRLGLQAGKKTKTGYSTDAETLAMLAPTHEIVEKVLEYRELTKLKSTYADSLPKLVNERTGRIHTTLNQAITSTGRLSSSDPNLQNIPIKSEAGREIRRAFVASEGNLLVSADYSQIDLRILAHVSRDPELLKAYQDGRDIHARTATGLFGVSEDEVTPDMRRLAKTVNFSVIYGKTDYGLSRSLNIPTGVAREYIESYFRQYPGVKAYSADIVARAREAGYVETLLGRRRYLPELSSPNRTYREFAERAAANMPIQGTAADIMKLAMISVYRRLGEEGFSARMVLQVHDELVFDAPEAETERLAVMVRQAMEHAFELDVPLEVEVKVGPDWCSALPVSAADAEVVPD